jgi:hypothetical protein
MASVLRGSTTLSRGHQCLPCTLIAGGGCLGSELNKISDLSRQKEKLARITDVVLKDRFFIGECSFAHSLVVWVIEVKGLSKKV